MGTLWGKTVVVSLSCLAMLACMRRDEYVGVEVQGHSVEHRVALAKRATSSKRRDWLIAQLKAQFPSAADEQLARVYLTWRQTTFTSIRGRGETDRVFAIVGISGYEKPDAALLAYSANQLEEALSDEGQHILPD